MHTVVGTQPGIDLASPEVMRPMHTVSVITSASADRDARRLVTALSLCGFLAALLMACMLISAAYTGASLLSLQSGRSLDVIRRELLASPLAALGVRISIALNTAFIVTYVSFFAILAARFRPAIGSWPAGLGLGAFLVLALFDIAGTQHCSAMLYAIERQLPVAVWEPQLETVMAGMRYHCSYVGVALLGLGYLNEGRLGRACAVILWLGYIPFGAILATSPIEGVPTLSFSRFVFFVVAFCVSGILFLRAREQNANIT